MKYLSILILLLCVYSTQIFATTYYIASSGSDSNTAHSKVSPWQHAPGMPNCSGSGAGTCGGTTPAAGDSFIFRGGDTWHFKNSGATPYTGGSWTWSWNGTSTTCQLSELIGAITTSSCIYIGVDNTWFSGGSYARPIWTQDNSLSTGYVSSCSFSSDGFNALQINANYVWVDGFDMQGQCSGTVDTNGTWINLGSSATQVKVSNVYGHGWTINNSGGTSGTYFEYNQLGANPSNVTVADHNIFDGTDSTDGVSAGHSTNQGLFGFTVVSFNVFRKMFNGCRACGPLIHDNLFDQMWNNPSYIAPGVVHGNTVSQPGSGGSDNPPAYSTMWFYNNTYSNSNNGIGETAWTADGGITYFYNNIQFAATNNCVWMPGALVGGTDTFYLWNNTWGDANCNVAGTNTGRGVYNFENDHFVDFSIAAEAPATSVNVGNNKSQTQAVANGQGYTSSNNYQPTSTSGITYHAGANLSSNCSGFLTALCNGSSGGEESTPGSGVLGGTLVASPPVRSSTWDAGAYQLGSGTPPVATPTICIGATCTGGAFASPQTITLSVATGGATICYTKNGVAPTTNGAGICTGATLTYSSTFSLNIPATVKSIGTESGYTDSSIATNVYTLAQAMAPTALFTLLSPGSLHATIR